MAVEFVDIAVDTVPEDHISGAVKSGDREGLGVGVGGVGEDVVEATGVVGLGGFSEESHVVDGELSVVLLEWEGDVDVWEAVREIDLEVIGAIDLHPAGWGDGGDVGNVVDGDGLVSLRDQHEGVQSFFKLRDTAAGNFRGDLDGGVGNESPVGDVGDIVSQEG